MKESANMRFKVVSGSLYATTSNPNTLFLSINNWNDYSYHTIFDMIYIDCNSIRHKIGSVRIGHIGQTTADRKPLAGYEFSIIDEKYFSLGVGTEYYENLNRLDRKSREIILRGLRDIAFHPDLFDRVKGQDVTKVSLLRGINQATVIGQYRRMAMGGAKLTKFKFWFNKPKIHSISSEMKLEFQIEPESNPPTNIHVVIGRNGVGKTNLINNMLDSLYKGEEINNEGVYFKEVDVQFVNVVMVAFSAFDTIKPLFDVESKYTGIQFKYIGLKTAEENSLGFRIKTADELANEFIESFIECGETFKIDNLKLCLSILDSDPNFKEANILQLLDLKEKEIRNIGLRLFNKLSSGHKIILLSITRLVETVQEKSLVFIDEPEAHLHPPLLSAFTRSLSELLININGVAIIATHSPVILQEVPQSCVYKLRRFGSNAFAERPEIECFGENVGVLTREVFGLEVTDSGFYHLLKKAVDESRNYEELINRFNDKLGMEARSLARVLFANKYPQS